MTTAATRTHRVVDSPVGELTLVGDGAALTGLYMQRHRRHPADALGERADDAFPDVVHQLEQYFAGTRRAFDVELRPRGDGFQRRVWDLLAAIPYGETRSYGQLAAELGGPGFAQAVGAANGRNPISIIVPCHRVVGADGTLVGYAGGLDRKRWLLDHERPQDVAARLF